MGVGPVAVAVRTFRPTERRPILGTGPPVGRALGGSAHHPKRRPFHRTPIPPGGTRRSGPPGRPRARIARDCRRAGGSHCGCRRTLFIGRTAGGGVCGADGTLSSTSRAGHGFPVNRTVHGMVCPPPASDFGLADTRPLTCCVRIRTSVLFSLSRAHDALSAHCPTRSTPRLRSQRHRREPPPGRVRGAGGRVPKQHRMTARRPVRTGRVRQPRRKGKDRFRGRTSSRIGSVLPSSGTGQRPNTTVNNHPRAPNPLVSSPAADWCTDRDSRRVAPRGKADGKDAHRG
ncbi:hypothetical protein G443_004357 [Actinoalloteichus cyanogriseus DSM 43889]|uniref:Uncharacterized protein n=1 Tax=Actinoalloteichus caeruleus DSM 43889 TaxID=1120930 RepID=A0ABT1JNI1_ACTCY|nr:hypothetical protein [Actinoalloteichus caeruleus DSM 43889]